jgi:hypothetical protein
LILIPLFYILAVFSKAVALPLVGILILSGKFIIFFENIGLIRGGRILKVNSEPGRNGGP